MTLQCDISWKFRRKTAQKYCAEIVMFASYSMSGEKFGVYFPFYMIEINNDPGKVNEGSNKPTLPWCLAFIDSRRGLNNATKSFLIKPRQQFWRTYYIDVHVVQIKKIEVEHTQKMNALLWWQPHRFSFFSFLQSFLCAF